MWPTFLMGAGHESRGRRGAAQSSSIQCRQPLRHRDPAAALSGLAGKVGRWSAGWVTTEPTASPSHATTGPPDDADRRHLAERSELLPEELAVGSDSPRTQAEAILDDSLDRTEHPDPDASTQSGRRTSADAADGGR